MKKIIKLLTIIMPAIMSISLIAGCTNNTITPKSKTLYFQRGVYKSYPADNSYIDFYVFYDEISGHTEDSKMGIGLPFSCIQTKESVKFKFGGSEEPEEIFKIESSDNQTITGYFEDGKMLTFEHVKNANPNTFDVLEYIKKNKN